MNNCKNNSNSKKSNVKKEKNTGKTKKKNVVKKGKGESLKFKLSDKMKKKLVCCGVASAILGGSFCFFGNNSKASNDSMLSSVNGKLYLVDVNNDDGNACLFDFDGNEISYDFNNNTFGVVGARNANTSSDKMYEVMLIDNDSNLTYGLMDGKYLSNSKIDSIKVLDSDFFNYSTNTNCYLYDSTSLDNKSINLDAGQELIVSNCVFQSTKNDYLWNEAILVNDNELVHGYIINDSLTESSNTNRIVGDTYHVIADSLNVRGNASIDANLITRLSKNTEISLCDDFEPFEDGTYRWVYVTFNNNGNVQKGWVAEIDYSSGSAQKLISNEEITVNPNDLHSECCFLYDITNDKVLFEKSGYKQMMPASITKILTAYLVSTYGNLNDKLTYSDNAVSVEGHAAEEYGTVPSSSVYHVVKSGNTISVRDALNISLLLSDNATTVALKEYVEKITGKDFEELMNKAAKDLGCTDSNFTNSYGYEDPNHLVTAHDMAMIAAGIRRDCKDVLEIMGNEEYSLEFDGTVIKHQSPLINKSVMANNPYFSEYALGCKTGWTEASGQTMVSIYEKDGNSYAIVSLHGVGIMTKNDDAKTLSDYAFSQQKKNNYKVYKKKIG